MESNKEDIEIEQVLPDSFIQEIPWKSAVCAWVTKRETSAFTRQWKDKNLLLDKQFLKASSWWNDNSTCLLPYQEPSNNSDNDQSEKEYIEVDCSFIKRVKSYDSERNCIIIAFIDHWEYIHKSKTDWISLLTLQEKDLIECELPSTRPITSEQYGKIKTMWPISNLISSKERYIITHDKSSKILLKDCVTKLWNDENDSECLWYNPKTKEIVGKGKTGKGVIDHCIMNMIHSFCEGWIKGRKQKVGWGEKGETGPAENTEMLFNKKDYDEQYYWDGLYVFALNEPCIMCSMAWVHSRIERIYFLNRNCEDGGLVTKIQLNNYNINHHYSVFEITW